MLRTCLMGMIACLFMLINCQAEEFDPTPDTLEKWTEDKEIVRLWFAGPLTDMQKLRSSLKTNVPKEDPNFRLSAGEGGGTNGSFIEICMKVTPENVRLLSAIQTELSPRGYKLYPQATRILSYKGDPETRKKAFALKPEFVAAVESGIKKGIPNVRCTSGKRGMEFNIPGTDVRGWIKIKEITTTVEFQDALIPDQEVYLPHLGLIITSIYLPQNFNSKNISANQQVIRKVFSQVVEPFLKLEPGASIRTRTLFTQVNPAEHR
jgi:hypothetical protein